MTHQRCGGLHSRDSTRSAHVRRSFEGCEQRRRGQQGQGLTVQSGGTAAGASTPDSATSLLPAALPIGALLERGRPASPERDSRVRAAARCVPVTARRKQARPSPAAG